MPAKGGKEADGDSGDENAREKLLKPTRKPSVEPAGQPRTDYNRYTKRNLAQIDVESREHIVEAELQRIPEKIARKQHNRSRIRPQYSNVRKAQKPRHKKAVVVAKHLPRKAERASRARLAQNHSMIVEREKAHRDGAHAYADQCAQRTCIRQEDLAGHDKRTPSDRIAERQGQNGP